MYSMYIVLDLQFDRIFLRLKFKKKFMHKREIADLYNFTNGSIFFFILSTVKLAKCPYN